MRVLLTIYINMASKTTADYVHHPWIYVTSSASPYLMLSEERGLCLIFYLVASFRRVRSSHKGQVDFILVKCKKDVTEAKWCCSELRK